MMISARGAMPTSVLLQEVAVSKAKASGGKPSVLLPELERSWAAMSRVLKAQLLLGNSSIISPKTCVFYISHKLVAHDGRSKFMLRVPNVAVLPQYGTTYSMDSGVPREPTGLNAHRLPLELVAAEAKLPAEVVSDALREVFLFVGESIFQGRLMMLEFAGVATVLLKRDRMSVTFHATFLDELFAIDTRKWPHTVKDQAEAVRPQPTLEARSRPASRASSQSRVRPQSADTRVPLESRPSFVPNAPAGRTFAEIGDEGPRAVRIHDARLAAIRRPPMASRGSKGAEARKPLMATKHHADPVAPMDAHEFAAPPEDEEEESIYAIMTPHRHRDVETPSRTPYVGAEPQVPSPATAHKNAACDDTFPELHAAAGPVQTPRPVSSRSTTDHRGSLNLFSGDEGAIEPISRGRKRIASAEGGRGVASLMWQPQSIVRASSTHGRPHYDNLSL
jgi:hypothetical protein